MKKFLIPAMVMAVASTAGFAAGERTMRAEATWEVTANKDDSSAISLTPVNSVATINYNPLLGKFEEAKLGYQLRIINGKDLSTYTVKASSSKHKLEHNLSHDAAIFDLSVDAIDATGAVKKTKLTQDAVDILGLHKIGLFGKITTAGEYSSTETLYANFASGSVGGVTTTDAKTLKEGVYSGQFNMIFDAAWTLPTAQ